MKNVLKFTGLVVIASLFMYCSGNDNTPPDTDPDPDPDPNPTTVSTTLINTLSVPWELVWGPDDFLWVSERNGKISRINPDTGDQQEVITISSVAQIQESGLLGMVHHPDFDSNPFVYAVYTYQNGKELTERLVRFTYANMTLSDEVILLDNIPANNIHNGARLLITSDLHILMSTGDAGNAGLSQDMNSLAGKILRLNLDGSIPNDNPFPGSYVYSYGHRNAQGLTFHTNGNLYSSEHGPTTDDEINKIEPSKNYGWPQVRGLINTPGEEEFAMTNDVVESIFNWTPTIAPSDLIYYTSDRIPEWTNKLLLTVLKEQQIIALTLSSDGNTITNQETFFTNDFGRLRDIAVSPTGRVFIATNGNSYGDTSATHSIIEINKTN